MVLIGSYLYNLGNCVLVGQFKYLKDV